jgi:hypothetical protein
MSMLFGIKRKIIKKERKNYALDDNEEIETILNNIEEINKPDPIIQRQEVYRPRVNISLGYEDDHINHSFIAKKRGNSVKIYDEDELPDMNNYNKIEDKLPEIVQQNEYEYKMHDGNSNQINDLDYDNYANSNIVGDGIHTIGIKSTLPPELEDYTNYIEDDINIEDNVDPDIQTKINYIKDVKERKRIMEPNDEQYDQDYQELKQIKTKELIYDIYQHIDNHDVFQISNADAEDSDKEMLEWEMSKLKNGISSHWTAHQNLKKIGQSHKPSSLNDLYKGVNTNIDINEIIGNVAEDIHDMNNKLINTESKLQIYEQSVEDSINQKLLLIHSIDKYVEAYNSLKNNYMKVMKEYKSKGKDIKMNIGLENLVLSD